MKASRAKASGAKAGAVALLVAVPLTLTACSGGNTASSVSAQSRALANGKIAQGAQQSPDTAAAGAAASPRSADGKSLIITAGLQVRTADVRGAVARAERAVSAAGGFVAEESVGSGPQSPPDGGSGTGLPSPATLPDVTDADGTQALLVLRVPPAGLDALLASLGGGGRVTYTSRTATDVTGQVADVASRVSSAQASIAEFRTLLTRAGSVNDLVSLEQALAQRESDLESLEAQQRALADQVGYATVTVGYFTQGAPAPAPAVRTGFGGGLASGWKTLTLLVRALLVALGWLVPFAAVALLLWWPGRRLRALLRTRRARTPAPGPVIPEPAGADQPKV